MARTEKSYNDRGKCNLLGMTPCGLPTTTVRFLFPNYHKKKSCGDRSIIAGYPYGARMMPYDVSTVYGLTILKFVIVQTITRS